MTNKEAIAVLKSELDGIPSDIDKSEFEQALDLAIKALFIVVDIEANFKRHSNFMMDSDDWDGIKTFAEIAFNKEEEDE